MSKLSSDGRYVERFSKQIVIAHWVNAVSFIVLFITALPMYTESFDFLYTVFGGAANTQLLHRIFAVIFILPTVFILITDPQSFIHWTKQITSWKKHDFQFFTEFPKEFFGKHVNMPKQDFFNAGQKLNSILTILCAAMIVCSGFVMWFKELFPKAVVLWSYPIHNAGVGLLVAVIIGHVYLSVGHPDSRPSFRGMTRGNVDIDYAKAHHGRWYDEIIEEDRRLKRNIG